jgi:hypothetical protein
LFFFLSSLLHFCPSFFQTYKVFHILSLVVGADRLVSTTKWSKPLVHVYALLISINIYLLTSFYPSHQTYTSSFKLVCMFVYLFVLFGCLVVCI